MSKAKSLIDARGPRFSALLTTIVLTVVLISESLWLLIFQAIVFLIGATLGPAKSPYGMIYKKFVQPRLRSELITEESKPPQFAQAVGLIFAATGILALYFQLNLLFLISISFALFAAILNAFFNFCLGCQMYLLLARSIKK